MTELAEIKSMLSKHIDNSTKQHTDMMVTLTRLETMGESEKKRMDKHEDSIENLKIWRNIHVAGFLGAISAWFK